MLSHLQNSNPKNPIKSQLIQYIDELEQKCEPKILQDQKPRSNSILKKERNPFTKNHIFTTDAPPNPRELVMTFPRTEKENSNSKCDYDEYLIPEPQISEQQIIKKENFCALIENIIENEQFTNSSKEKLNWENDDNLEFDPNEPYFKYPNCKSNLIVVPNIEGKEKFVDQKLQFIHYELQICQKEKEDLYKNLDEALRSFEEQKQISQKLISQNEILEKELSILGQNSASNANLEQEFAKYQLENQKLKEELLFERSKAQKDSELKSEKEKELYTLLEEKETNIKSIKTAGAQYVNQLQEIHLEIQNELKSELIALQTENEELIKKISNETNKEKVGLSEAGNIYIKELENLNLTQKLKIEKLISENSDKELLFQKLTEIEQENLNFKKQLSIKDIKLKNATNLAEELLIKSNKLEKDLKLLNKKEQKQAVVESDLERQMREKIEQLRAEKKQRDSESAISSQNRGNERDDSSKTQKKKMKIGYKLPDGRILSEEEWAAFSADLKKKNDAKKTNEKISKEKKVKNAEGTISLKPKSNLTNTGVKKESLEKKKKVENNSKLESKNVANLQLKNIQPPSDQKIKEEKKIKVEIRKKALKKEYSQIAEPSQNKKRASESKSPKIDAYPNKKNPQNLNTTPQVQKDQFKTSNTEILQPAAQNENYPIRIVGPYTRSNSKAPSVSELKTAPPNFKPPRPNSAHYQHRTNSEAKVYSNIPVTTRNVNMINKIPRPGQRRHSANQNPAQSQRTYSVSSENFYSNSKIRNPTILNKNDQSLNKFEQRIQAGSNISAQEYNPNSEVIKLPPISAAQKKNHIIPSLEQIRAQQGSNSQISKLGYSTAQPSARNINSDANYDSNRNVRYSSQKNFYQNNQFEYGGFKIKNENSNTFQQTNYASQLNYVLGNRVANPSFEAQRFIHNPTNNKNVQNIDRIGADVINLKNNGKEDDQFNPELDSQNILKQALETLKSSGWKNQNGETDNYLTN